jgi:hypothetical protein
MAIIHENSLSYPETYNSDRNIFMSGGGKLQWSSTAIWSFDKPIYINWLAGRLRGSANFNIVQSTQSPVTIPLNSVAYVVMDQNTDGASLNVIVCSGSAVPQNNDNLFVLAIHRDIGEAPNNPLQLSNGAFVKVGSSWNSIEGAPITGFAGNFSGVTWTIPHNLNTLDVMIELRDNSTPPNQIFANKVEYTDLNTLKAYFQDTITGRALIVKGNYSA